MCMKKGGKQTTPPHTSVARSSYVGYVSPSSETNGTPFSGQSCSSISYLPSSDVCPLHTHATQAKAKNKTSTSFLIFLFERDSRKNGKKDSPTEERKKEKHSVLRFENTETFDSETEIIKNAHMSLISTKQLSNEYL